MKHKCNICGHYFPSGPALGGHRKYCGKKQYYGNKTRYIEIVNDIYYDFCSGDLVQEHELNEGDFCLHGTTWWKIKEIKEENITWIKRKPKKIPSKVRKKIIWDNNPSTKPCYFYALPVDIGLLYNEFIREKNTITFDVSNLF